jgi:bifunctional UDP-N-acetylglucosamine pyrophosphorylase/glucosamine-1-phosphate N-acetyltransferase
VSQTSTPQPIPVVILAAGQNSRFFPLNSSHHKGLISLLGKPLLVHQLENLSAHGFNTMYVVASPGAFDQEKIDAMLDAYNLSHLSVAVVEQKQPLGMGDAVLLSSEHIHEQFAVVFPYHVEIGETLRSMIALAQPACVAVTPIAEPWLYGIIEVKDQLATALIEKPPRGSEPTNLKVQGAYLLNQQFLSILKEAPVQEYSFEMALDALMHQSSVGVHMLPKALPTLKFPWHIFDLQSKLISSQTSFTHPKAIVAPTAVIDDLRGPVIIEEGATVSHAARIVGPAYLGKNSFVGDFSLVRESDLEAGASVGVHADITRSIFLEQSSFHGGGFIGDSIIGERAKLGAGIITANKRFDRLVVRATVKDKKVATNMKAFGVVVGAESKLGIRVSTMPGVMIGANQIVAAGEIVTKNLPHA